MEFLSDGTDASFPGLFFLQPLLEEIFQEIKLLPAGLIGTDIEPEELALMLENVGLEHLVEEIGVFGVNIRSSYRIENGLALIELVVQQLLFGQLDPFCIVYKEAFFCSLHFVLSFWLVIEISYKSSFL